MATEQRCPEPLCDATILKRKRVYLVEKVHFENVMPCIIPFLIFQQIDTIYGEKTMGDKIGKILDILERLTNGNQYNAFNAFLKALSGTQPDVFEFAVGRPPTDTETEFCVKPLVQDIRDTVIAAGHLTDSELDEQIDLAYEHVQLSIVDRESSMVRESNVDGQLPHEYSHHLTDLKDKDRNITASDILGDEDKPHKKVLIFGRAGIGKSTTFQWFSKEWALGRWATGFTLLFLLRLRSIMNPGISVSCVELLALYSLYPLQDITTNLTTLTSWIRNSAGKILILLDGLDEIPRFMKRMISAPKITNLCQKASPLDICINIIKGNLLPGCTVICASRPFVGLNVVKVDAKAEILGLDSEKITRFVENRHPMQANQILSALQHNPILLSACSITFYCMMITRLMSEGVELIGEELTTYTQLMAFILVQYTSRKLSDSGFLLEVSEYFPKLAKLAYNGIFQSEANEGLPKLVFGEDDLVEAGISSKDLDSLRESGILQILRNNIGHKVLITAEFFHLSAQELLAAAHYLSVSQSSDLELDELFSDGQFNMCLVYMFGLNFDKNNTWINKLYQAVRSSCSNHATLLEKQFSSLLDSLSEGSLEDKLKMCQLIHEAQWEEKAKQMSHHVVSEGKLSIGCDENRTEYPVMTALDVLSLDFVCQHSGPLTSIRLCRVHADDTFVNMMLFSLYKHNWFMLQELDLSHNSVEGSGAEALVQILASNTSITTLNMAYNEIGDIGAEAIAEMLDSNTSVTKLDVSYNSMGDIGVQAIAQCLVSNTSLTELGIGGIDVLDSGAKAIGEMLANNTTLTELNISASDMGAQAVAEMLANKTSLVMLDISFNKIGDMGAEAVAEMLAGNTTLKKLNIKNNKIGDTGVVAIAKILASNSSVQELDLRDNEIGDTGAKAIAQMLASNSSLTELKIAYNEIGGVGGEAIARALWDNTCLTHLNIKHNAIGDIGGDAMAQMLASNTSLSMLNLQGNKLDDIGFKAIASTSLSKLNILATGISDVGAAAIAEMLSSNSSLTELIMSYNEMVGDIGAAAIADALASNTSLRILHMRENGIGDIGAAAIADALASNRSLTELDMSDNEIGDDGAVAIAEMLQVNTGLRTLDVSGKSIGDVGAQAVADALPHNSTLTTLEIYSSAMGAYGKYVLKDAVKRPNLQLFT